MKGQSLALFFRCFSVMFRAGLPIAQCFDLLAQQQDDEKARLLAEDLAAKLRQGYPLERAMRGHDCFSRVHLAMVTAGARSGALDHTLESLAVLEEKQHGLVMKVRAMLSYPLIMLVLTGAILLWLPGFAMDGLFELLRSSGAELPWITRVFSWWSGCLRQPLFYPLAAAALWLGWRGGRALWNNEEVRDRIYPVLLGTPALGSLIRSLVTARFSHCLGSQLRLGIPVLEALKTAAEATGFEPCELEARSIVRSVQGGASLAEALRGNGVFHRFLEEMAAAGEESGKLPEFLQNLGVLLDAEVEHSLSVAVQLLEPLILAAMGLFVGVFVIATALPVVQLIKGF